MTNVEMHKALCEELNRIYEKKNHDYGDSFHQTFLEEGMAMPRIRLSDKLSRFKALTRNGGQEVNDESILDTLLDLANYALMTAMELTEYEELYADTSDKPVATIRVNPHALPRKDRYFGIGGKQDDIALLHRPGADQRSGRIPAWRMALL